MEADRPAPRPKQEERARQMMPLLRLIEGAAPVMQAVLTTSEHWNRYLTFLQGYVERTKARKMAAEFRLADPAVWDPQALMKLKGDILAASAMIEAWEVAIQLPRAIIDGGAEAEKMIKEFEEKYDQAAGAAQP